MKLQYVLGVWYASYRDVSKNLYIVTQAPTRERAIAKGLFMVMGYNTPQAI